MWISGVYTITNLISNKLYVGKSYDIDGRWRQHRSKLNKGLHANEHLQKAWNHYGPTSFQFEILVECSVEQLYSEEHYWATLLNVHNKEFGYNMVPTFPNGTTGHSDETKKKISDGNKGKNSGRKHSAETIQKRKEARVGKKYPKRRDLPRSSYEKAIITKSKRVLCITTGKEYIGARFAGEELGMDRSQITKVCRGEAKQIKGHSFKYI